MNGRFFLDTQIFVYCFDRSAEAKCRRSAELVRQGVAAGKGVVSYQVVQEFFNVALRRFEAPMTPADAEQYLLTVFRPLLAVHSSHALYAEGLHLKDRHHLSWYDALIVAGAVESGCDTLYTEDLQHGRKFASTRVENPFR